MHSFLNKTVEREHEYFCKTKQFFFSVEKTKQFYHGAVCSASLSIVSCCVRCCYHHLSSHIMHSDGASFNVWVMHRTKLILCCSHCVPSGIVCSSVAWWHEFLLSLITCLAGFVAKCTGSTFRGQRSLWFCNSEFMQSRLFCDNVTFCEISEYGMICWFCIKKSSCFLGHYPTLLLMLLVWCNHSPLVCISYALCCLIYLSY